MAKTGITFKARLRAWWEGVEVAPDADEYQRKTPRLAIPVEAPIVVAPLEEWETARTRITQLVWGHGYDKPGGAEHILDLVQPFELDATKVIMDFGAGLGGAAHTLTTKFGATVMAFEGDVVLSRAGKQISILDGLDRKAEIQRYVPGEFEPVQNSFDCVLSTESLHAFDSKYDTIALMLKGLKAKGHVAITDYTLGPGIAPTDKRLKEFQQGPLDLWRPDQYEQRFSEMNLELKDSEDITDNYRKMILQGWMNFAQGDKLSFATAKAHPAAVINELNMWTKRLDAIEKGLVRFVRFHAVKRSGARLMSDW
jgi:cyclopropane fatty-acyl-phospholipid synthase-like methyltransferase